MLKIYVGQHVRILLIGWYMLKAAVNRIVGGGFQ